MAVARPAAIAQELDRLSGLGVAELRDEWRQLYKSEPPRLTRALFVLALSYRVQERSIAGSLGGATRRQLEALATELRATGRISPTPNLALKPGARLVREWRGRAHSVTVTERGFEYCGAIYAALTPIARKITGAHWSGPRFFGLPKSGAAKSMSEGRRG